MLGAFLAGFGAGWAVRSTVDTGRKLAVTVIAVAHEVADRTQRWVAIEREYFDDLFAEGRAQYAQRKARARGPVVTRSTHVGQEPSNDVVGDVANPAAADVRRERAA
jgi:hypothetical protein